MVADGSEASDRGPSVNLADVIEYACRNFDFLKGRCDGDAEHGEDNLELLRKLVEQAGDSDPAEDDRRIVEDLMRTVESISRLPYPGGVRSAGPPPGGRNHDRRPFVAYGCPREGKAQCSALRLPKSDAAIPRCSLGYGDCVRITDS